MKLENGDEVVLETLGRGAVIHPVTFLTNQKILIFGRCITQCSCFVISQSRFLKCVSRDNLLAAEVARLLELATLDEKMVPFDFIYKVTHNVHPRKKLSYDENQHAIKISRVLKSTVIEMIHRNKESRKIPKLKDILHASIEQNKKLK